MLTRLRPNLVFLPDPATGGPAAWHRHVSEMEVEEVLLRRGEDRPALALSLSLALPDEVPGRTAAGEAIPWRPRIALGRTLAGRPLRILYLADARDSRVAVLAALPLTGPALLGYLMRSRERFRRVKQPTVGPP